MGILESLIAVLGRAAVDRHRERAQRREAIHALFRPARAAAVDVEDCLACAAADGGTLDFRRYKSRMDDFVSAIGHATASVGAEFPELDDISGDPEDRLFASLEHYAAQCIAGADAHEQCEDWREVSTALAMLERTLTAAL